MDYISQIVQIFFHIDVLRGALGSLIAAALVAFGGFLLARWIRRRFTKSSGLVFVNDKWPTIADVLNRLFVGKVTLRQLIRTEPTLEMLGDLVVEDGVKNRSEQIASMRDQNAKNAILVSKDDLGVQPPKWRVQLSSHSTVLALREKFRLPLVLSGNVLLCCSERNEVYFHYRSEGVDTKKSVLHILGGSYEHRNDEATLRRTAEREVWEESGVSIAIPADCVRIVATEDDTGFVQLNFCGVDVPAGSVDVRESTNIRPSRAEGDVFACPFPKIGETLVESPWAESGKAVVLAWLALGAPSTRRPGFSSRSAMKMYQYAIERLDVKARAIQ